MRSTAGFHSRSDNFDESIFKSAKCTMAVKNVAACAVTALALSVAAPEGNAQPPDRGLTKTVQGVVRRSTTAPMGEIDGAVLEDVNQDSLAAPPGRTGLRRRPRRSGPASDRLDGDRPEGRLSPGESARLGNPNKGFLDNAPVLPPPPPGRGPWPSRRGRLRRRPRVEPAKARRRHGQRRKRCNISGQRRRWAVDGAILDDGNGDPPGRPTSLTGSQRSSPEAIVSEQAAGSNPVLPVILTLKFNR